MAPYTPPPPLDPLPSKTFLESYRSLHPRTRLYLGLSGMMIALGGLYYSGKLTKSEKNMHDRLGKIMEAKDKVKEAVQ
ncbi:hypothetical protein HMI54_008611 [Coelomomyces lativittatus]|nr:hypothetical protein HMI55_006104 [Coelomomyces lativittatus]KAJ1514892.1 hypothetical protein HMI56_007156 [Coelomomyces lativittatus]KAJ1518754.1 hypothetical protein HMI54_008611 [Coelomomyces lativittatus]